MVKRFVLWARLGSSNRTASNRIGDSGLVLVSVEFLLFPMRYQGSFKLDASWECDRVAVFACIPD